MAESHISVEMVKDIMNEFTWPTPYTIEEGILEGKIILNFSSCTIKLFDVPEDGISLTFSTYDNGKILDAKYREVVFWECIENYNPREHLNLEYSTYEDLKEDTRKQVRNKLKNLQYYHLGFIAGIDYSWVERFLEKRNEK